jgi:rhomboid protease GluP
MWLPLALSWVLVIVIIQPRLRMLNLKDNPDSPRNKPFFYHLAAVLFVAVPTIVAQHFIHAATGEITFITNASGFSNAPITKYYAAPNICLDRTKAVAEPLIQVVGKRSETLSFELYVMVPICRLGSAAIDHRTVWVALKFQKSISSNVDDSERRIQWTAFARSADSELSDRISKRYTYLQRVDRNYDLEGYRKALRHAGENIDAPTTIALVPHDEPFDQRTGSIFAWTFGSFFLGALGCLGLVLIAPAHRLDRTGDEQEEAEWRTWARTVSIFLVPTKKTFGLQVLLDLNIFVFVAMAFSSQELFQFKTEMLLDWGANYGPELHGLGLSRLVTSEFVHSGAIHLLNNLFGLFWASACLGRVVQNSWLILCYLLAGVGGAIASTIVHPNIVSVGASGAVFGLFGIYLVIAALRDDRLTVEKTSSFLMGVGAYVGINLLLAAITPHVDNAAHIGGLAVGAAIGLVIFVTHRKGRA